MTPFSNAKETQNTMSMPTTLTPPAATGRRGYPGSVLRDDPYTRMRHQDLLDRAPRYQQTAITAPTVADTPYGPWPDLIRDVFGAHHAPEQPVVLDQDDVRGDRALHRDIITALTASDGFHAARALTRDRPLEAAIATMATAEHLAGDIEGRLAQAAKAAQAAQEARERYERALDTGEGHEQITALHQEATDMQAAAQDAARTAAAEAAEAAKDATGGAVEKVRAISTIPGFRRAADHPALAGNATGFPPTSSSPWPRSGPGTRHFPGSRGSPAGFAGT